MIIGVVGKANVGKSTFFKALTLADVLIANYPFATIKPNTGFGMVRVACVDKEFNVKCNPRMGYCDNGTRFVPVEVIDVAGLVPGAHEGKGMGNQFLDDLRQADALIHIVDMAGTTNEKGEPRDPGSHDPAFDIRFLEVELDLWYLSILKKGWEKFARQIQQEHADIVKALAKQLSGLKVTEPLVKNAVKALGINETTPTAWSDEIMLALAKEFRKATKPMIIAANKMDIPQAETNLERIKKEFPHLLIVPCSAESELALKEAAKAKLVTYQPGRNDFAITGSISDNQQKALLFIKEQVLKRFGSTGVQNVLDSAVFTLLNHIAVFPGGLNNLVDQYGRVLPDCFLIPKGSTALDFAFKIHTDLGNKFIRAIDVKQKKTVGKEHLLNHRDVIEIVARR